MHLGKVKLHSYVVLKRSTKVPEIAQRQDALKKLQAKLQAAHKVFPVKITQHDSQGGTRTVFAREIEWLKKNEADLNIEEQVLEEDKTTAELASREPKVILLDSTS